MGNNDGGLGIISRCVLRHVQKTAQLTVTAVKTNAAHIDTAHAAVQNAGQNAAQQNQNQSGGKQ